MNFDLALGGILSRTTFIIRVYIMCVSFFGTALFSKNRATVIFFPFFKNEFRQNMSTCPKHITITLEYNGKSTTFTDKLASADSFHDIPVKYINGQVHPTKSVWSFLRVSLL